VDAQCYAQAQEISYHRPVLKRSEFLKICASCILLPRLVRAQAEPVRLWTVGDSTVQPLALGIEYVLKEAEAKAVEGQRSFKLRALFRTASGLARPDFFDWPAAATAALAQGGPDVAVVCLGANDTQPLLPRGRPANVALHTPEWRAEYTRRLEAFARLFVAKSVKLYFMLPSFEQALKHADSMQEITECMRAAAESVGVRILDASALLVGEDGQPRKSMVNARGQTVSLRSADGLHLSGYGGVILARGILRRLSLDLEDPAIADARHKTGQERQPGAVTVQMRLK
jgi:uncharacterized protein